MTGHTDVFLVNWRDAERRIGQRVRDRDGRVMMALTGLRASQGPQGEQFRDQC